MMTCEIMHAITGQDNRLGGHLMPPSFEFFT